MNQNDKTLKSEIREKLKQNMLVSLGLVLLGGIITWLTYSLASNGGTYVLAWGPMVFGAIGFIKNLVLYIFPNSLLNETSLNQGSNSGLNKMVSGKKSLILIVCSVIIILIVASILTSNDEGSTSIDMSQTHTASTNSSTNTQALQPASQLKEIESGDILNEVNSRRTSKGLSTMDYSAVLQNIAQNLAIFNYQNPSLPIGETVLEEYFNGQEYYPAQSAYQALTDVNCYLEPKELVDKWYASTNNYLDQRFKEIGIYIGVNDRDNCNIFLALARP